MERDKVITGGVYKSEPLIENIENLPGSCVDNGHSSTTSVIRKSNSLDPHLLSAIDSRNRSMQLSTTGLGHGSQSNNDVPVRRNCREMTDSAIEVTADDSEESGSKPSIHSLRTNSSDTSVKYGPLHDMETTNIKEGKQRSDVNLSNSIASSRETDPKQNEEATTITLVEPFHPHELEANDTKTQEPPEKEPPSPNSSLNNNNLHDIETPAHYHEFNEAVCRSIEDLPEEQLKEVKTGNKKKVAFSASKQDAFCRSIDELLDVEKLKEPLPSVQWRCRRNMREFKKSGRRCLLIYPRCQMKYQKVFSKPKAMLKKASLPSYGR